MSTWTARAEGLDDTEDEADAAASIYASGWAAGLDRAATVPLRDAAFGLGASSVQLMARKLPWATDREMFDAVDGLATDVRWRLRKAVLMAVACRVALVAAYAALAAARAMPSRTKEQAAAKERAIAAARRKVADCEEALEILAELGQRLTAVSGSLDYLPEVFGAEYEGILRTVDAGIRLPHDMTWFDLAEVGPAPAESAPISLC